MKETLSEFLFFMGIAVGALKTIDWSLTRSQRTYLENTSIKTWYWISNQTMERYSRLVRTKRVYFSAYTISVALVVLGMSFIFYKNYVGIETIAINTLIYVPVFWLCYKRGYSVWLLSTQGEHLPSSTVSVALLTIFLYILSFVMLEISFFALGNIQIALTQENPTRSLMFLFLFFVSSIFLISVVPFTNLLFVQLIALLSISTLIICFYYTEKFIRRIAENEKGPVFALATLLSGIGYFLKYFE